MHSKNLNRCNLLYCTLLGHEAKYPLSKQSWSMLSVTILNSVLSLFKKREIWAKKITGTNLGIWKLFHCSQYHNRNKKCWKLQLRQMINWVKDLRRLLTLQNIVRSATRRPKPGSFSLGLDQSDSTLFETIQLKSICCCPILNKQTMKMWAFHFSTIIIEIEFQRKLKTFKISWNSKRRCLFGLASIEYLPMDQHPHSLNYLYRKLNGFQP